MKINATCIVLIAIVSCREAKVKEAENKPQKKENSVIINIENSNGNSVSVAQNDTVISINDSLKY